MEAFVLRRTLMGAILFLVGTTIVLATGVENSSKVSEAIVQQSGRTVSVTVHDSSGPVIGANILVKGTTTGSITDMNGKATIEGVPNNAVLVISYIGYITQEVSLANNQRSIAVTLKEDTEVLDEVVVVGYGTQAKKDITGSIAVVSRDAIQEQPVATFAEALQGKAAGVYVNTSGGPSGETTIRVRGVGSVNGSDPLIIVDGIQGVDINSVNPNDIDSFQVLKDAAATAIYGAKAANGVIIITTKQGNKEGKVRVSYNGYISASKMANDGYNTMNAWDYMKAIEQSQHNQVDYRGADINAVGHQQFGSIKNGELTMPYTIHPAGLSKEQAMEMFGSYDNMVAQYQNDGTHSYALSAYYYIKDILGGTEEEARRGTDWYDMVTQTGISQNHELSVQGGGTKGQYAISLGYTNREGTIKNSGFERYNLRVNTTFNPTKHFTIGQNTNASTFKIIGERGRQGDDSVFGRTYTMNAWVPAYNVGGDFAGSVGNGGRASSALEGVMNTKNDWNRMFRLQSALFAEVKDPWIKGLTLRSQFSIRISGNWGVAMYEKSVAWNKEGRSRNYLEENAGWGFDWQWTNTASYKTHIAENHDITLLIGTEALKNGIGRNMTANRYDYIFEKDPNTWSLNNGGTSTVGNSGSIRNKTTMFGIFGRADYSYKGKYLATFTIRRDASSKFAAKNRWGTFPSLSVGWRISDEKFLSKAHATWLDDLKLRAGYGSTGNSNIGAYNYAFQYTNDTRYLYGISGSNSGANTGYGITNLGDNNAKWETVKMFNIGYDFAAFHNKLTSSLDFYIKKTSDMLVPANWTALAGAGTKPNINIGDLKNTGIDFSIGWRDKIGQVGYNINFNTSWYKNKVTKLGSSNLYTSTRISQMTITTVGQPISMFYGYVDDGIYKSEEEVLNYKNDNGQTVLPYGVAEAKELNPSAWVGHYKWKDTNNDGKVDANDRAIIGNPHPDLTGGINLSLTWKDWDMGTYLYYSLGNDLYKHFEYYTLWGNLGNVYSYDRVEKAWNPSTNPNGTLPLWIYGDTNAENTASHSNYIQDGSYLRMQTLTLGYSLPKSFVRNLGLSRIRLYAQMSNVFTITGYDGLDPEVRSDSDGGSNDMMKGVDYGSYGMPRQYLFGINVDF
ncbi:SusC/RagA family TonB-linked outer membrane protein [Phocaeicola oris]|uniref:SusC/RagA family TonB-linked outer membrane protein n=1 Tax=Phocaeicola oris TaxID=2896850 RepID=UPI00234E380F|nr:TonB-dependent receptor [Phocaeicola oris]MCE2617441.1 TonB-dependent receptor [Phocaeicola oris]